jgi:hypothetical protein
LGRFELGQKRVDLVNVLKTAAEKAVVHQVAHLKKAFIMEEKGQHIIKVKICFFNGLATTGTYCSKAIFSTPFPKFFCFFEGSIYRNENHIFPSLPL